MTLDIFLTSLVFLVAFHVLSQHFGRMESKIFNLIIDLHIAGWVVAFIVTSLMLINGAQSYCCLGGNL